MIARYNHRVAVTVPPEIWEYLTELVVCGAFTSYGQAALYLIRLGMERKKDVVRDKA